MNLDRFDELLSMYLDNELDEPHAPQLAAFVRDDPAYRRRFVQQTKLAGLLHGAVATRTLSESTIKRTMEALPLRRLTKDEIDRMTPDARVRIAAVTHEFEAHSAQHRTKRVLIQRWHVAAALLIAMAGAWIGFRVIAASANQYNPQTLATPAVLERSSGKVFITSSVSDSKQPARGGQALNTLDGVETQPGAKAVVKYWDGTTLTLTGSDTGKLWMSDRQNDIGERTRHRASSLGKRVVLESGVLVVTAAKQPANEPMVLITPHADAEIIGTKFTLTVTPNATRLDVFEGSVKFTRSTDNNSILVSGSQHVVTGTGTGKLEVQPGSLEIPNSPDPP